MKPGKNEKETADQPVKKMDIPKHPDNKIDQDFPNYPHYPGKDEIINPETSNEKKIADVDNKDGEKINYDRNERTDEGNSDGSANAFERSEGVEE